MDHRISVVVFKEGSALVGQCLEHDIAVQGDSLREIIAELQRTLLGHILICLEQHREPFDGLPPAPDRYRELFEKAPVSLVRRLEVPPEIHYDAPQTDLRVA